MREYHQILKFVKTCKQGNLSPIFARVQLSIKNVQLELLWKANCDVKTMKKNLRRILKHLAFN